MRPVTYTATAADAAAGYTPPIPVDYMRVNGQYGLKYLNAAGGAGGGTVQYTIDDVFNLPAGGSNALTWVNIALTANFAQVNEAVTGFRVNNPTAGDVLRVVAQGGTPAG